MCSGLRLILKAKADALIVLFSSCLDGTRGCFIVCLLFFGVTFVVASECVLCSGVELRIGIKKFGQQMREKTLDLEVSKQVARNLSFFIRIFSNSDREFQEIH